MRANMFFLIAFIGGMAIFPGMSRAQPNVLHERVYVQTDKQCYLAGETVWLKLQTMDGAGNPVSFSKTAYIEFSDSSHVYEQLKIAIQEHEGYGKLVLPHFMPTGTYELIGYTRYMRNEGEEVFFRKSVPVINTFEPLPENSSAYQITQTSRANGASISTDRPVYSIREKGFVTISNIPEEDLSLSISIAGKDVFIQEGALDLSSWMKRVALAKVPESISADTLRWLPEYEGHIIVGSLVDRATNCQVNDLEAIALLSSPGDQVHFFVGQVLPAGEVYYYTKHILGKKELITTVTSPIGGEYRIDIQSPFAGVTLKDNSRQIYPLSDSIREALLDRSVGLQALMATSSNSIRELVQSSLPDFRCKPNKTYHLDDYTRFPTMEEVVIEFVSELRFVKTSGKYFLQVLLDNKSGFSNAAPLILLDGIPLVDHGALFRYNPLSIESIDIYQRRFAFGKQLYDGLVFVHTYQGEHPGLELKWHTQFFDYESAQPRYEFYSPAYDSEAERTSRIPDFRHTLLWNPSVQSRGRRSISIPFYTSDVTGPFTITVEGVTKDGKVIQEYGVFQVD